MTIGLSEVTPFEAVTVPQQILLVEDEKLARESLGHLLQRHGYDVVLADSGSRAIREAQLGDIGVVLMDIRLGEQTDGIDAAQEIQMAQPHTPIIFVSAYAGDPTHRQRVQESQIREGGWLEKPIQVPVLEEMIDRELQKRKALAWVEELQDVGLDPLEHLDEIAGSLSPDMLEELKQTIKAEQVEDLGPDALDEVVPLRDYDAEEEEQELLAIAEQIDAVYDEILALVEERKGDPNLKQAMAPLRDKLEELEERQADAMERCFRSQLQYDPRQGRRIINRAKKVLGRR